MQIKRSGNKVFGVTLNAAERKAMDDEIKKQLVENVRAIDMDIDALILWELHEQFGFGPKKLKSFYDNFKPALDELLKRYDACDDEQTNVCVYKLKECGVDIKEWYNER